MCREIDNDGYPEGNIHGTSDVDSYTLGDGHCRNGVASYRFIRGSANATAGNSASADATARDSRAGSSSSETRQRRETRRRNAGDAINSVLRSGMGSGATFNHETAQAVEPSPSH